MRSAILLALSVLAACGRSELLESSPAETAGSHTDAGGSGGSGNGGTSASGAIVSSGGSGGRGGSGGTTTGGGTMAAGGVVGIGGMPTGGGVGPPCTAYRPCGGDLVGTWTVKTSCLWVLGQLDLTPIGLVCPFAQVNGFLQVGGTWAAKADGTQGGFPDRIKGEYADNTTTWGSEQLTLPASCLSMSGTTTTCDRLAPLIQTLGYAQVSCTSSAEGGCVCTADVKQAGGMGLLSDDPQTSGQFRAGAGLLSTDSDTRYFYCSSGNTLTFSPVGTGLVISGSIELQR